MILIVQILIVLSPFSYSKELVASGDVFSEDGQKLYELKQYKKTLNEGREETTVYFNQQNKPVLKETIVTKDGQFESYKIDQLQSGQSASVDKSQSQLRFNRQGSEKQETETIEYPSEFAIGSTIVNLAEQNFSKLLAGNDVDFELGLWDRQKLISFYLRKDSESKDQLRVKMNPSNFFIRQFVDTIYFTFDKSRREMIKYEGRTNLLKKSGDEFEPLNAVVRYQSVKKL